MKHLFNTAIPSWLFNLIIAITMLVVYNYPHWHHMLNIYHFKAEGSALFLFLVFIVLTCLFYSCMTLLSLLRIEKPVTIILILINSCVLYFMNRHAALIDSTMIENVLQTDWDETKELIGNGFYLYLGLLGILPALIVYKIKIKRPKNLKHNAVLLASILIPVAITGIIGATQFQTFASMFRNHKEIRYYTIPNNYLNATYKTIKSHVVNSKKPDIPLIRSYKNTSWKNYPKKTIFVLVVGETARAENFSLNGYARETNPELKKLNILNFSNTHSCGTATAISLPCMFSSVGRKNYDRSVTNNPNNLFQLVSRAGFKSIWIDNNSGCKGLCTKGPNINTDDLAKKYLPADTSHEVYDETMLSAMDDFIKDNKEDAFIVLHQKGSHGPAYYQRTPEEFHKFQPICTTDELTKCSKESIRNSYDNTILYTDHFLSDLIHKMQALSSNYNVAMIYMSDHGESLGENNLYLHGLPYMIAPDQQKHVPFMMWLSDGFSKQQHIDTYCLQEKTDTELSHDNLFHSVLDVLDIKTQPKNKDLSIFNNCRSKK